MIGNWVLFFTAIQHIGIADATIVFHVQPFIVVVLGGIVFRERLHVVTFAWIALALAGLSLATSSASGLFVAGPSYLIGVACALGGAFLYSGVTIIAKGIIGITGPQLAFVQSLCGVILLATVAPIEPFEVTSYQWGWFSLIGIAHTGGVYVLLYNALPKISTPLAAHSTEAGRHSTRRWAPIPWHLGHSFHGSGSVTDGFHGFRSAG